MLGFFIAREHRLKAVMLLLVLAVAGLIAGIATGVFEHNNRQYKVPPHQAADREPGGA
jgi:hypothetical protein